MNLLPAGLELHFLFLTFAILLIFIRRWRNYIVTSLSFCVSYVEDGCGFQIYSTGEIFESTGEIFESIGEILGSTGELINLTGELPFSAEKS
ncbi:hypothetical protein [Bacillus sp. JJ1609]|uniref:hypothetical protein n=1 Tax=Bacillus sp. JJ1609 TaxID=3122977 RepID=UPI002FFF675A